MRGRKGEVKKMENKLTETQDGEKIGKTMRSKKKTENGVGKEEQKSERKKKFWETVMK